MTEKDCTCPHDWTSTPPDLTAAGNQGPPTRTWTRMLTVKTCPVHGKEDDAYDLRYGDTLLGQEEVHGT